MCTCTYVFMFVVFFFIFRLEDLEEQPTDILRQSLLPGVKWAPTDTNQNIYPYLYKYYNHEYCVYVHIQNWFLNWIQIHSKTWFFTVSIIIITCNKYEIFEYY